MDHDLSPARERLRALVERSAEFLSVLRAQRRLAPAAAIALAALAILGVSGWAAYRAVCSTTPPADPTLFTHLLVCGQCGQRTPSNDPTPARSSAAASCRACGAVAVHRYRYGSLAVPPGGWSTSSPASSARQLERNAHDTP